MEKLSNTLNNILKYNKLSNLFNSMVPKSMLDRHNISGIINNYVSFKSKAVYPLFVFITRF